MNPVRASFLALACLTISSGSIAAPDGGDNIVQSRLIAPPDPVVYYDRIREGIRLFNGAKFEEAVPKFRASVDEYPVDGAVWIYLGQALRRANRPKEAIAAFEKGLELTSTWKPFSVRYSLAQCYLAAGDKEGAYRTLETMLNEDQYVRKPDLYEDPGFAALKSEPRFQRLVGHIDTSKMSRTEGWRTDIDYLVAEIKRVNHLYRIKPLPEVFMTRYRELRRDVPRLTDEEIYAGMGKMLAPLRQGHLSLALFPETKSPALRTLPLQFYAFPEGIFVVGSDEKNVDLVGCEVLKIEETPPAEVLRRVEEHASVENRMNILWGGMQAIGTLPILRGIGVLPPGHEEVRLTLRTKAGGTIERTLGGVPAEQNRKLVPPPGVAPPLFVKDVPRAHWFQALPDAGAVYAQVNQVAPDPDETMAQFGLKLRAFLAENPTKNVILDVRHNNGGNTTTYPELLRTLVGHTLKEDNRLYVIIGRGVYSATSNLITDLERLARPIFVGEPSSGTGNQDGDESFTVLPYSGIRGFLTSVWWQYSHPWDRRTSLVPDVPVQLTAKAYFAGLDPALETILALIKRDREVEQQKSG